jgi:hypothetical protein
MSLSEIGFAEVSFDEREDLGEEWLVVDPELVDHIAREPCHVDEQKREDRDGGLAVAVMAVS